MNDLRAFRPSRADDQEGDAYFFSIRMKPYGESSSSGGLRCNTDEIRSIFDQSYPAHVSTYNQRLNTESVAARFLVYFK